MRRDRQAAHRSRAPRRAGPPDDPIHAADTLFVLPGAILGLFMHAGFAFLEVGTVREKNQVDAPVKIFSDFALSTVVYFFVGYPLAAGRAGPGFLHNGPLAGLVAVCAGPDVMHPVGSLVVGAIAGFLFVWAFTQAQNRWGIDDVLGIWPLHGLCGAWGGLACEIFGLEVLGGLGGVSPLAQVIGTLGGVVVATLAGFAVYGVIRATIGIRLGEEAEFDGADLAIHKISATPR